MFPAHAFRSFPIVAALLSSVLLPTAAARGVVITLEPDDYAAGTALTSVSPYVTLQTLDSNNQVVPLFTVTSTAGDSATTDLSPTGSRVFAHNNIPFFNTIRKLQADFNGRTSSVSIAFAGGTPLDTDTGRLEVYDEAGNLLDTAVSPATGYGQFATLTITRPTEDIARAVIYSGEGEFGEFDALSFNTPVPEPSAAALALSIAGVATLARRRPRKG
jgi:hypothetical protein